MTTEWGLFADSQLMPRTPPNGFPWNYEWIEIKRDEWEASKIIRYSDIPPQMNIAGLHWRPAKRPDLRPQGTD